MKITKEILIKNGCLDTEKLSKKINAPEGLLAAKAFDIKWRQRMASSNVLLDVMSYMLALRMILIDQCKRNTRNAAKKAKFDANNDIATSCADDLMSGVDLSRISRAVGCLTTSARLINAFLVLDKLDSNIKAFLNKNGVLANNWKYQNETVFKRQIPDKNAQLLTNLTALRDNLLKLFGEVNGAVQSANKDVFYCINKELIKDKKKMGNGAICCIFKGNKSDSEKQGTAWFMKNMVFVEEIKRKIRIKY